MANFNVLRLGSRGPQVELLQLGLTRAGLDPGNIDGIFGQNTLRALRAFQSSRGLQVDGIAGPETWKAIQPYLLGYATRALRAGDTFYRLAMEYGTTIRAIETANPGLDPLNLRIGQIIKVPFGFDAVPDNISFTSTVLELSVAGLIARYPFITSEVIGRSVMGKPLYALRIGTGSNEVFYNASHHANEWITSPLLMRFLEKYAEAYSSGNTIFNQSAVQLFNRTSLYIVPMVNPDGVDLVTGEISSGSYYRGAREISAAYPSIPFPNGWKANIRGIDPNLQYPAGWENARRIKFAQGYISPAPRDYVGSSPLEAPESAAVYNFTLRHNFSLTLSYHTQGQVIYWRYLDFLPPGSLEIAETFGSVSGYAVEETPSESGYAGYKDWFILNYNRPGYTIEAGEGVSPLPISQFGEIYSDNLGILTLGMTVT